MDLGQRKQGNGKVFGKTKRSGQSINQMVFNAIFGEGVRVANFYSINPNTGSIYIAATAPDEADGTEDGASEDGALYKLELTATNGALLQLESGAVLFLSWGYRRDTDGERGFFQAARV